MLKSVILSVREAGAQLVY